LDQDALVQCSLVISWRHFSSQVLFLISKVILQNAENAINNKNAKMLSAETAKNAKNA
jgi:hypothetical protein